MSNSLQPIDCSPPGSSIHRFSREEYWSGYHFLLQGIFPSQGSNPGLPHCRQTFTAGRPSEPLGKSWRLRTPDHNKEGHKMRDGGEVSILKCLNKRTERVHYANQSNSVYCRFLFGKQKKQNGSLKPSASNIDTCNCEQLDSRGRKSDAQSPVFGVEMSHIYHPFWKAIL